MGKATILIADKDEVWANLLAMSLQKQGYGVETTPSGRAAIELCQQTRYAVMILDLVLADLSGLETVRQIKATAPEMKFIILTSRPTQESMMEAIHEHLFDYLCKPIDLETLIQSIRRATEEEFAQEGESEESGSITSREAACPNTGVTRMAPATSPGPTLVGESEAIRQVRQQIAEVTPTNMTVLIHGESGTGKGVVAQLIHEHSQRGNKGTLVKINCPAIPESLFESELFGHEAGAFTGAEGRKPGRFELAHGGTIFLDEIGEIPPQIQVKLLHVIESKELQRIGGSNAVRVDARILAATNASLERLIAAGQFRADLFYRLNEYIIHLPPLRERIEDIPLLVEHFVRLYGREFGREDLSVSPEVMALLLRHPWHGNVRELESVIRRFALTGREESILPALQQTALERPVQGGRETLRQSEIQMLMSVLIESRWNQRRAANVLGISYSALRRRIEKYRLKVTNPLPQTTSSM